MLSLGNREIRYYLEQSVQNGTTQSSLEDGLSFKIKSMIYCVLREKHCFQSEQFQVKDEIVIDEIVPLLC